MKIKDILNLITDRFLYIELIEEKSGASFDILDSYSLKNLMNCEKTNFTELGEKEIKNINVQYYKGQRQLILKF